MEKIIKNLEKQLLSKIGLFSKNKKDAVEQEKVQRYLNLVKQYYELQKEVEEQGIVVTTENANQRFLKENPAFAAQIKISGQLLAIERSFSFKVEQSPVSEILSGGDLI